MESIGRRFVIDLLYSIDISVLLDNLSVSSADGVGAQEDEDELENEPVRLSRTNKKVDQANGSNNVHLLNDPSSAQSTARHSNPYPQSRQPSAGIRSMNNVSFMSDLSKTGGKSNGAESTGNNSGNQLKTVGNSRNQSLDLLLLSYSIVSHRN